VAPCLHVATTTTTVRLFPSSFIPIVYRFPVSHLPLRCPSHKDGLCHISCASAHSSPFLLAFVPFSFFVICSSFPFFRSRPGVLEQFVSSFLFKRLFASGRNQVQPSLFANSLVSTTLPKGLVSSRLRHSRSTISASRIRKERISFFLSKSEHLKDEVSTRRFRSRFLRLGWCYHLARRYPRQGW